MLPYNDLAFEVFLKAIGEAHIENWTIMAEALGVHYSTIMRWKQHPMARQALRAGLAKSLDGMEKYGKEDWRMHREKAKMLGAKDKSTLELEVGETVSDTLDALQSDYGKLGRKAEKQVVEGQQPLQNKE